MSARGSPWKWLAFARGRVLHPPTASPCRPYGLDSRTVCAVRVDAEPAATTTAQPRWKSAFVRPDSEEEEVHRQKWITAPDLKDQAAASAVKGASKDDRESISVSTPTMRPSTSNLFIDLRTLLKQNVPDVRSALQRIVRYVDASYAYSQHMANTHARRNSETVRRNDTLRRIFHLLCSRDGGAIWAQTLADHLTRQQIAVSPAVAVSYLKSQLSTFNPAMFEQQRVGTLINTSLNLAPRVSPQLFSFIMNIHIRMGTSAMEIEWIVKDCMAAEGYKDLFKWPPEAFDVMIKVNARDGDPRSCLKWYKSFRQSDPMVRRRRGDLSWPSRLDTLSWPYKSILESQPGGASAITNAFPRLIISHMERDQVPPPIELTNRLLDELILSQCFRSAVTHWEKVWRAAILAKRNGDVGVSQPNLNTYILGFKAMGSLVDVPLHGDVPPLREMIRDFFGLEQLRKSDRAKEMIGDMDVIRACFNEMITAALHPAYRDFPLVVELFNEMKRREIRPSESTVDRTLRGILDHAWSRRRSEGFVRHVLGGDAATLWRARRGKLGGQSAARVKAILGNKLRRGKAQKALFWELLTQRFQQIEVEMIRNGEVQKRLLYDLRLPMLRPSATLQPIFARSRDLDDQSSPRWAFTRTSLHDARSEEATARLERVALIVDKLTRQCVVAQATDKNGGQVMHPTTVLSDALAEAAKVTRLRGSCMV